MLHGGHIGATWRILWIDLCGSGDALCRTIPAAICSCFHCYCAQMEHEKKEEAIQREIDRYRGEKTKLETERKMKQDRMVCKQYSFIWCCIFC